MKLFTIGDSISQGFMSGSAARTDLSFSSLIANQLGIENYQYPNWPKDGLPFNIESIFRELEDEYGSNINTLEWGLAITRTIPSYLNKIEKYYERGEGAENKKYPGGQTFFFHNVATRGFNVSDSWLITPKYCQEQIAKNKTKNGLYSAVDSSFLRTALRVLNPQLLPEHQEKSQLEWLKYHSDNEGVENVIIWLGANNALGTILGLNINFTEGKEQVTTKPSDTFTNDKGVYNLWHPKDFEADYVELLSRIDSILGDKDTKVFLGTVPLVTIAPFAKGVGETFDVEIEDTKDQETGDPNKITYFKYYTYFPFDEEFAFKTGINLSFTQVLHIDNCIREYNNIIKKLVIEANLRHPGRYTIIDYSAMLDKLAFKRNGGVPKYKFPDYFKFQYPIPNTKYYHADTEGNLKQGGIFSLDGVHPSAIAHGLLAYETLKAMKNAGVNDANSNLDWDKIIASDTLYQKPITMMHEIYDNTNLAEWLLGILKRVRKP